MNYRKKPINGGLVPAPAFYRERRGFCDISSGCPIVAPGDWLDEARLLSEWLEKALGRSFPVEAGDEVSSSLSSREPRLSISRQGKTGGEEWHKIDIGPAGIRLLAEGAAGVVRGASSIAQLALSGKGRIPAATIEDYPRFAWRGLMLDMARSYFSVGFIEKTLDLAALHKLNTFHWHLTDDQAWRLELSFAPEAAELGSRRLDGRYNPPRWRAGSYGAADIARVVEYARIRHITIVPEIETPGHAVALLASHPEFSCAGAVDAGTAFKPEDRFGVFDDILCAGNDEVFRFIGKVLDAVCEFFPGPYVHMGGDEAPKGRWRTCPRCVSRMEALNLRDERGELDPERLQAWFMGRMAGMLAARGRRMIGWDEIMGENLGRDVVVMAWRNKGRIAAAASAGFDVVACPQTKACYLDHKQTEDPEEPGQLGVCTLEDCYAFDPVPPGLDPGQEGRIIGAQGNLWSELLYFGRQAEYMLFPRLCALAEVFWTPKARRDYPDFLARMSVHRHRLDAWEVNSRR
ncbi:MAG TPA: beta-N-acetylhexosaminidase [Rectinemataceae bacterium]|nr:beta-N-acetylhexosaminidase [Rectinemataceae bacterium]